MLSGQMMKESEIFSTDNNSPLLQQHRDTINQFRRAYSSELPPAELELKLYQYAKNAERTYNPSKNASFKTHLSNHLNKIQRDVHQSGSHLKVSEDVGLSINKIRLARDEFYMKHGREPSDIELSKFMNIPLKQVQKYGKMGEIKTVLTDNFSTGTNYVSIQSLLPDLDGQDKKVADTIEKEMPTKEALKYTGLSNTTYYKARNDLRDRMRRAYLRQNTLES